MSYGLESHLLTPQEVKARIPIIDRRVIRGGYYVPTDSDVRGWYCWPRWPSLPRRRAWSLQATSRCRICRCRMAACRRHRPGRHRM